MAFLELAEKRYSCRSISDRPVEEEKIEKILRAAQVAPTACNLQPFKIWVIDKDEDVDKIKETTRGTFGAHLFFVVGADNSQGWNRKYDGRNFADVDASIVATHMMMAIEDLGLATTWVGSFDNRKLAELFPMMEGYDLVAIFPVGYANEDAKPFDLHEKTKSLDELVERI